VAQQGDRLKRVEDGQGEIKEKIDKSAEAHQKLQERYLEQSHKHELEIQAIQLRLKNYEDTVKKVEDLEKKVFAYALLAAVVGTVAGALFAGLPAWLERHPQKDSGSIIPPVLVRGRG
jgi:predicted nuclease with TOPRIM domain